MNAWTVYWLFKMDALQIMFFLPALILGISVIIAWVIFCVFGASGDVDEDDLKKWVPGLKMVTAIQVFCMIVCTAIPDTKTMAAIIVLPKIASAENLQTVSKDAGEIYGLAMQRLKDAIGEQPAQ